MDALIYGGLSKGSTEEFIRLTEKATTAKMCNMLFNLPEVLANLEKEFEKQKEQKVKFIKAQEGGRI